MMYEQVLTTSSGLGKGYALSQSFLQKYHDEGEALKRGVIWCVPRDRPLSITIILEKSIEQIGIQILSHL